jgi:hypothetical protein
MNLDLPYCSSSLSSDPFIALRACLKSQRKLLSLLYGQSLRHYILADAQATDTSKPPTQLNSRLGNLITLPFQGNAIKLSCVSVARW